LNLRIAVLAPIATVSTHAVAATRRCPPPTASRWPDRKSVFRLIGGTTCSKRFGVARPPSRDRCAHGRRRSYWGIRRAAVRPLRWFTPSHRQWSVPLQESAKASTAPLREVYGHTLPDTALRWHRTQLDAYCLVNGTVCKALSNQLRTCRALSPATGLSLCKNFAGCRASATEATRKTKRCGLGVGPSLSQEVWIELRVEVFFA
jgi:hypothetical protein